MPIWHLQANPNLLARILINASIIHINPKIKSTEIERSELLVDQGWPFLQQAAISADIIQTLRESLGAAGRTAHTRRSNRETPSAWAQPTTVETLRKILMTLEDAGAFTDNGIIDGTFAGRRKSDANLEATARRARQ